MLTKRIIPCLDVKDGKVVKGINFKDLKDIGSPAELAKAYEAADDRAKEFIRYPYELYQDWTKVLN